MLTWCNKNETSIKFDYRVLGVMNDMTVTRKTEFDEWDGIRLNKLCCTIPRRSIECKEHGFQTTVQVSKTEQIYTIKAFRKTS
jgi:hypothetical protein